MSIVAGNPVRIPAAAEEFGGHDLGKLFVAEWHEYRKGISIRTSLRTQQMQQGITNG